MAALRFGYTILYVSDVAASLDFYERALGQQRRFVHESGQYAELDTGPTTPGPRRPRAGGRERAGAVPARAQDGRPADLRGLLRDRRRAGRLRPRRSREGAEEVTPPQTKPWGQDVAYVRDPDGNLVEIASPAGGAARRSGRNSRVDLVEQAPRDCRAGSSRRGSARSRRGEEPLSAMLSAITRAPARPPSPQELSGAGAVSRPARELRPVPGRARGSGSARARSATGAGGGGSERDRPDPLLHRPQLLQVGLQRQRAPRGRCRRGPGGPSRCRRRGPTAVRPPPARGPAGPRSPRRPRRAARPRSARRPPARRAPCPPPRRRTTCAPAGSRLDAECAAHERVDPAEVRVRAGREVRRRLPLKRRRWPAAPRCRACPDSNWTFPSAIG